MLLKDEGPVRHYCLHIAETGFRKQNWALTGQVQIITLVFQPPLLALPCLGVPGSNPSQQVFWSAARLR